MATANTQRENGESKAGHGNGHGHGDTRCLLPVACDAPHTARACRAGQSSGAVPSPGFPRLKEACMWRLSLSLIVALLVAAPPSAEAKIKLPWRKAKVVEKAQTREVARVERDVQKLES